MFKFVVVFAFVAAAVAEPKPDVLLSTPYVQPYTAYSSWVSPATTSISSSSSSVLHPSPITYASPLGYSHFIKKRSADPQLLATPFNYFSTGYELAPSTIISNPTVYSSSWGSLPIAAHLIKKRSAQLLATPYTSYLGNPAISPLVSSSYIQTPYYGAQLPLVNTHFIKKRSAEATPEPAADPQLLASSYLTPSTYINTIATPYAGNPLWNNNYWAAPLATTHFIKKRSAEAQPEAAPAPAADPQLAYSYPNIYSGPSLYSAFPAASVINSAPLLSTNPFGYSTYIKK